MQHLSRQLTKGFKMKTVGDFKKAGLVFIDGDIGDGYKVGLAQSFSAYNIWDNCIPKSFAWRENTGVMPEFKGYMELKTLCGDVILSSDFEVIDWELTEDDRDIIKWRPALDQTEKTPSARQLAPHITDGKKAMARMRDDEAFLNNLLATNISKQSAQPKKSAYDVDAHVSGEKLAIDQLKYDAEKFPGIVQVNDDAIKPVFTQAMADAGEFPPVGIEVIFHEKTGSERIDTFIGEPLLIIGVCKHKGKHVITWCHPVYGICCANYSKEVFKPIDNRTPKQKAVDEMMKDTGWAGSAITDAFEKLHDAGYRQC